MTTFTTEFTAHVGIDWADKKHDFCIQFVNQSTREFGVLTHSAEKTDDWVQSLNRDESSCSRL